MATLKEMLDGLFKSKGAGSSQDTIALGKAPARGDVPTNPDRSGRKTFKSAYPGLK